MQINKSTRHSKITGDFAERLVLYWLSKYGFECAHVDHVGLDLLARNPHTNELMGLSVKSRSRTSGTERTLVSIGRDHIEKLETACVSFGCAPYLAVVVDAADAIVVYLVRSKHFAEHLASATEGLYWSMSDSARKRYETDPNVYSFRLVTETRRWWGETASTGAPAEQESDD